MGDQVATDFREVSFLGAVDVSFGIWDDAE